MEVSEDHVNEWLGKVLPVDVSPYPDLFSGGELTQLEGLCANAKRPLVCLGGGAKWAASLDAWVSGLERIGIPYVTTLMGQERIRAQKHYFNMIGSYGNRVANWGVQNCDLLIVLGARLDVRQTGSDVQDFARNAKIVQVDIDSAQLENRVRADLAICCDLESFMSHFELSRNTFPELDLTWVADLGAMRRRTDIDEYSDWSISPTTVFRLLNEFNRELGVEYVCDVGNHQMWAAQGIRLGPDQTIHHSGGMGAMGFALPAAIGIALSSSKKVIVITGDGSLQVNSQELDTVHRLGLNLTIVVMNNFSLGMVKNFQDMYFDGRDQSTRRGYSCPSFARLAAAYGIPALQVGNLDELRQALEALVSSTTPLLIEILMKDATECRPRLSFGARIDEQYPRLK
jgi:acetolactate synthase-1/2/3 large subunit